MQKNTQVSFSLLALNGFLESQRSSISGVFITSLNLVSEIYRMDIIFLRKYTTLYF